MKSILTLILFCSLLYGQDGADFAADSLHYYSDTVLVSSSFYDQSIKSTPFAVDRLEFSRADAAILNSFDQTLQSFPGIIINNRFNASQGDRIILRGMGSRAQFGIRGIKIILDDIPLTFPDGQSQLNNLDINSVGSIEVVRGPSSFLYGNSAGGLISIKSNIDNAEGYTISPQISTGSFKERSYSVSGNYTQEKYSLNLVMRNTSQNGYRDHSDFNTNFAGLIYKYKLNKDIGLSAVFNYNYSPYLLNPSSLDKSSYLANLKETRSFIKLQGAGKRVEQYQGGLNLKYSLSKPTSVSISLYSIRRNLFNAIPGSVIKLNRISAGISTTLQTKFNAFTRDFNLLVGVNYSFQGDDRREYENNGLSNYPNYPNEIFDNIRIGSKLIDQNETINALGLFGKLSFDLSDNSTLTFGQRFDTYNFRLNPASGEKQQSQLSNLSPMVGLTYSPVGLLTLYANYSTAFQTPTFNEISNNPNPGQNDLNRLKPEKINSIELGLRGWYEDLNTLFSFSIYNMLIYDMLIAYQIDDSESGIVYYRNSGEVLNRGCELSLEWAPTRLFNLNLVYNYISSEFVDYKVQYELDGDNKEYQLKGNELPGIPEHSGQVNISFSPISELNVSYSVNYSASFYTNDFNGPKPGEDLESDFFINDDYLISYLRLSYVHKLQSNKLQLYAGINNLFNSVYSSSIIPNASFNRFFEPGLPRNYYLGLRFILSGQ